MRNRLSAALLISAYLLIIVFWIAYYVHDKGNGEMGILFISITMSLMWLTIVYTVAEVIYLIRDLKTRVWEKDKKHND